MSATATASTIDDVIDGLRDVVADAVAEGSCLAYFAALYRQVTLVVRDAIGQGEFDDGSRMSTFDAAFGNRYFEAVASWRAGAEPTRSWAAAFRAADGPGAAIVQHLLLGMNAHINLDLAVAAAEVAPGDAIDDLRRDFFHLNEILVAALDRAQGAVNDVSPFMRLLDRLGGRTDEQVLEFNLRRARAAAWAVACELARLPPDERQARLGLLDERVAARAGCLARPAWLLRPALAVIRAREHHDVATVVERLDRCVVSV